ncbi:hypothetical protein GGR57DRAFT_508993 [Xylariaceae sp. FL1272]|nr:hypothetical protein GGR57DRAFT_508993 [Xylariaceae sp. FL1272]
MLDLGSLSVRHSQADSLALHQTHTAFEAMSLVLATVSPLTGATSSLESQISGSDRDGDVTHPVLAGQYLAVLPSELKIMVFKELTDMEAMEALASSCKSLRAVYERYQDEICESVGLNMIKTAFGHADWDLAKYCIVLAMATKAYHPLSTVAYLLKESRFTLRDLEMLNYGLSVSLVNITEEEVDMILRHGVFQPPLSWKKWSEIISPLTPRLHEAKAMMHAHIMAKLDDQDDASELHPMPYTTILDSEIENIASKEDSVRATLRRISADTFLRPISGEDFLLAHIIMWAKLYCEIPSHLGRLVEDLDATAILGRAPRS